MLNTQINSPKKPLYFSQGKLLRNALASLRILLNQVFTSREKGKLSDKNQNNK